MHYIFSFDGEKKETVSVSFFNHPLRRSNWPRSATFGDGNNNSSEIAAAVHSILFSATVTILLYKGSCRWPVPAATTRLVRVHLHNPPIYRS